MESHGFVLLIHDYGTIEFVYPDADVAELADALDSGSSEVTLVEVQVLSSAPHKTRIYPSPFNLASRAFVT
jgi:hypothetical protein